MRAAAPRLSTVICGVPSQFMTTHKATCSTLDAQTLQILFTESDLNFKMVGSTKGRPFRNPYSSRPIDSVHVRFYAGCDSSQEPVAADTTSMAAF